MIENLCLLFGLGIQEWIFCVRFFSANIFVCVAFRFAVDDPRLGLAPQSGGKVGKR